MKNQYGQLTKSDNALLAEERGLVTYSRLTAWQKRAVQAGVVRAAEWHHTSAAANCTNYYNLNDFESLDKDMFKAEKKAKTMQADLSRLKIEITFRKLVGGFTSRYKKFETVTVSGLDVRKKDDIITGAGGRRLSSNNEQVKFLYKKPRARIFQEITKSEAESLGYNFI